MIEPQHACTIPSSKGLGHYCPPEAAKAPIQATWAAIAGCRSVPPSPRVMAPGRDLGQVSSTCPESVEFFVRGIENPKPASASDYP